MRVDEYTVGVLELPAVLGLISSSATTTPGRAWVGTLRPTRSRDEAETLRDAVGECMASLRLGEPVEVEGFEDLSDVFRRLRPEGAALDGSELRSLLPLLRSARTISRLLRSGHEFPALGSLAGTVEDLPPLRKRLERALLPDGGLADEASAELSRIRREIVATEERLQRRLERLLRDVEVKPYLQDTYVTRRGDRSVIPVRRSDQGRIRGVLHDVSQSGETAFIEPLATLGLGNELMRLQSEERAEIRRILGELSQEARGSCDILVEDFRCLTMVDGIAAVAAHADREGWIPCPFRNDRELRLVRCRHPLLEARLAREGHRERLVPLSLTLEAPLRALVISGSNTGGKTVVLKTVGLTALLASSGLPLPAAEGTELPWLPSLGAVIGDEQSISDDLSTFSARMRRVALLIRDAEAGGLAILDELGSGTEPGEGAALACAVLEELGQKKVRSIASTHLDEVKAFAHAAPGFVNAAVSFDAATLEPTYHLRVGEPGSSHAIEIARRVGLGGGVIDRARGYVGPARESLEKLVRDLNRMREEAQADRWQAREDRICAEEERAGAAREREELGRARAQKLADATREAEAVVAEAGRTVERLVEDFRRKLHGVGFGSPPGPGNAGGLARTVGEMRRRLREEIAALEDRRSALEPEASCLVGVLQRVAPGDRVHVRSLGADGRVESVDPRARRCRVAVGSISAEIPTEELLPPRGGETPGIVRDGIGRSGMEIDPRREAGRKLVLVGQRVDPALSELEAFLNEALLQGYGRVRVVHGLGTGVLARAVREYLAGHPAVREFRAADPAEGGEAVTLVEMN